MSAGGGKENGSQASLCDNRQNPRTTQAQQLVGRCSAGSDGGCQPREEILPSGRGKKRIFESSAIDGDEIVERKAGFLSRREFFQERGMEHGRVVSGDGDGDALAEKFGQWVERDSRMSGIQLDIESVGAEIAGEANFERNFAGSERIH